MGTQKTDQSDYDPYDSEPVKDHGRESVPAEDPAHLLELYVGADNQAILKSVYIPTVKIDDPNNRIQIDRVQPMTSSSTAPQFERKQRQSEQKATLEGLPKALAPFGLRKQASNARAAVQYVGLPRHPLALHQLLAKKSWFDRLRVGVANPSSNLSSGDSAELGLTLLILLGASHSSYSRIMATGKLTRRNSDKERREDGYQVTEVNGLRAKFELAKKLGQQDHPLPFFTPCYSDTSKTIPVEQHFKAIIAELKLLKIIVYPVESLWDAMKILGINKTRMLAMDWAYLLVVGSALLLAGMGTAWHMWLHQPIRLAFVNKTPKRYLLSNPQEQHSLCRVLDLGIPALLYGQGEAGYAEISTPSIMFDPNLHLGVVSISQYSPPKVKRLTNRNEDCRYSPITAGTTWCFPFTPEASNQEAAAREEETRLLFLASLTSINFLELAAKLDQMFTNAKRDGNLPFNIPKGSAIATKYANGVLEFHYKTLLKKEDCQ